LFLLWEVKKEICKCNAELEGFFRSLYFLPNILPNIYVYIVQLANKKKLNVIDRDYIRPAIGLHDWLTIAMTLFSGTLDCFLI
jgi:hypothetical protein